MTYDFFLQNYTISDYIINKIYVKDNKLYIDLTMPIHLELIANGYRPELDMTQEKTFIFFVEGKNKSYKKNSMILFEEDTIFINKDKLKITLSKVDIL